MRSISVAGGATLDFWGNNRDHAVNIALANTANLTSNGGGTPVLSGTVTLTGTSNISANNNSGLSNMTINGQVTGGPTPPFNFGTDPNPGSFGIWIGMGATNCYKNYGGTGADYCG